MEEEITFTYLFVQKAQGFDTNNTQYEISLNLMFTVWSFFHSTYDIKNRQKNS